MAAEKAKNASRSQSAQDELVKQLEEAESAVVRAKSELREAEAVIPEKQTEASEIRTMGEQLEREQRQMQTTLEDMRNGILNIKSQIHNKLAAFGKNMNQVMERIQQSHWYGKRPVGPFGQYVKVRDPGRWAGIMRNQIGGLMSSFAVTDARDRAQLRKILMDLKK
jgi:structural maintenance of chromosomes protein 6